MVRPVGKVLVGVGVRELVLDDVGAGVDETRVRDDAELFDFARLKQNRVKSFFNAGSLLRKKQKND